jgi:hypothetical protein
LQGRSCQEHNFQKAKDVPEDRNGSSLAPQVANVIAFTLRRLDAFLHGGTESPMECWVAPVFNQESPFLSANVFA